MLCRNALVPQVITAGPDDTIGDALTLLKQHGIRAIPIVGAGDTLLGWFSFDVVLANLLPGPITVEHHGLEDVNLRLDYLLDGEDSVANRLKTLSTLKLREVMSTAVPAVHPDTPLWEGIRKLFQHGSPVPVVEESSGRLIGLLSVQSVICELAGAASDCAGRR
jgi:CBS domain-containing protein